jgi:phosphoribosylanthranilate isomerase
VTGNWFMTWVKICGMTNLEDALLAVDAGADAVGFVFYEKSPRCVTVERAQEICAKLPDSLEKIGVFVGASADWVDVVLSAKLSGIQNYVLMEPDAESQQAKAVGIGALPKPFRSITALPIGRFLEAGAQINGLANNLEHLRDQRPGQPAIPEGLFDTFMLDSGGTQSPGGTGQRFDWSKAMPISDGMRRGGLKVIVAGGLTPQNVGEAMEFLKPWGVDVVSGVEASPGKKDPEKVRAFVRAVREMDRRVG